MKEGRDGLPRQARRSRSPAAAGGPRARAAPAARGKPAAEGGARGAPRRPGDHRRGAGVEAGHRDAAPRRGHRHHGAAAGRERDRQGAVRPDAPRAQPARGTARSSPSTAPRFPRRCSRPSSSATRRARSPAPRRASRDASSWRTAARCSSTRSATCRSALQAKILRALEEKRFERVGGTQSLQVDVRLVSATNRNLKTAVAARQFREDLFFRLSVFPIDIPPLRERVGDIEILARHFVDRFCRDLKKRPLAFSPEALDEMQRYEWPGNVRELQNCIERACILTEGDTIQPRHLNLSFRGGIAAEAPPDPWEQIDLAGTLADASRRVLTEVERRKIAEGAEGGRRSEAEGGGSAAGQLQDVPAEDEGLRDRWIVEQSSVRRDVNVRRPSARSRRPTRPDFRSSPELRAFRHLYALTRPRQASSSSSVTSSAIRHEPMPVASTKCSRPSTTFLSRRVIDTISFASRSPIGGKRTERANERRQAIAHARRRQHRGRRRLPRPRASRRRRPRRGGTAGTW